MIVSTEILDSAEDLLAAAYQELEFDQGTLLSAARTPEPTEEAGWVNHGDWRSLAAQVGAESIFFVDRDPVIVFAKAEELTGEALQKLYEQIWCMARPQILFLATPGQLSALDLTKPPPRPHEKILGQGRLIAVATSIAEVQSKLGIYHRERMETGAAFGEERFRNSPNRADHALIRDLKTVRQQLAAVPSKGKEPELRHLHSLIGRAIFIRYLEDRGILPPTYFEEIAGQRKEWKKLLDQPPNAPDLESRFSKLQFLRVLQKKDFTYALFDKLSLDFNGDTFPIDDEERNRIQQAHLDRLRGFLTGSTSKQKDLFFFAYRFDVIPIELISAIYEEFYNERTGKNRNQGSHYTPPALVEFLLADTLTPEVLAKKPRVIDPACGSGIFLVESFRRMVRYLCVKQNGKRVDHRQLRKVLRDQIAGIDINEEAVRVAAFSLYLAFLHYQKPREINDNRPLPYLKWVTPEERHQRKGSMPEGSFFNVLLHANAFEVMGGKFPEEVSQRFGSACASVVVGNPPWGNPKQTDTDGQNSMVAIKAWCDSKRLPVGDKELSQAFIHLTGVLLKEGGKAGLLVSSGVLFKHHKNSRNFRRVWLRSTRLEKIVVFAHARHVFFSGIQRQAKSISPFISIVFEKTARVPPDNYFQYWSAKRTAVVENTRSVILNRGDMHWLSQSDCLEYEKLWKIYWWGGHRDEALVRSIERFPALIELPKQLENVKVTTGQGFQKANGKNPANWLEKYRELPSREFRGYGSVDTSQLVQVPDYVKARGVEEVYKGRRLLIARGIRSGGHLTARFETMAYCFRNSIHGVRLKGFKKWQEAIITAVFWSSLARYYYFNTVGSWGLWHDEIHLQNVEEMPIRFPTDTRLRNRIVRIVKDIQNLASEPQGLALGEARAQQRLPESKQRLLDAAVFDLYQLNSAERDLVQEMCTMGLNFFYQNQKSDAVSEVICSDLDMGTFTNVSKAKNGLSAYLRIFLESWKNALGKDKELVWRVLSPPSQAPLLAVSFSMHGENLPGPNGSDKKEAWQGILTELNKSSILSAGTSKIFIDTFFRHVGEHEILFVKRNEKRFWTRTAAREDAESTLTHLMNRGPIALSQSQ